MNCTARTLFDISKNFKNIKISSFRNQDDENKYSELDEINPVTCEETNICLSPYKHSVKHMNKQRYLFFYPLCLLDYYNQIILSIKALILKSTMHKKCIFFLNKIFAQTKSNSMHFP